jgi:predicted amidohydrolase
LLKARAIENQCYVIGVNRSGKDPRGFEYAGGSAIFDPLGQAALDLGAVEVSKGAYIEMDKLTSIRNQLPFQQDADNFQLA